MKLFQNSYDFNYPWDQVTAANWKKYPNEISTHVIAVDVLRRELKDQGKVLVTERLITVKQGVPKWIMMMLGGTNMSHVREVSVVDLNKKSLTMRSCNLTMCNLLKVYETVTYSPHPDDSANKTLFQQEAQITAYGSIRKLCNKMEDWSVQRFCENAKKGIMGFDAVLQVFSENWEKHVDDLSNQLVSKVNETMEDVKISAGTLLKGTERSGRTILQQNIDLFRDAYNHEN